VDTAAVTLLRLCERPSKSSPAADASKHTTPEEWVRSNCQPQLQPVVIANSNPLCHFLKKKKKYRFEEKMSSLNESHASAPNG
jgi:hypothetical protein